MKLNGKFSCSRMSSLSEVVVVSDSETAFRVLESFSLIFCHCLVILAFFLDCFFDPMYPIFCLCGVITRWYLSF